MNDVFNLQNNRKFFVQNKATSKKIDRLMNVYFAFPQFYVSGVSNLKAEEKSHF